MIVVSFSGGVDSTVLAHQALAEGRLAACVFFRYGQANLEMEMAATREWCAKHNVRRISLDAPIAAAALHIGQGAEGARVVPARNMVFASFGVAAATTVGASELWLGPNADDIADYADCRPEFIAAVDAAAAAYGVRVRAPLIGRTKAEVFQIGMELGVDFDSAWTCYQPAWRDFRAAPCGTCNACRLRAQAATQVHRLRAATKCRIYV